MAHPGFTLIGDAVWLDFVNTALGRTPNPPDLLPDAAAFGRWAVTQRLLQIDRGPAYEAVHALRSRLTDLAALGDLSQAIGAALVALYQSRT